MTTDTANQLTPPQRRQRTFEQTGRSIPDQLREEIGDVVQPSARDAASEAVSKAEAALAAAKAREQHLDRMTDEALRQISVIAVAGREFGEIERASKIVLGEEGLLQIASFYGARDPRWQELVRQGAEAELLARAAKTALPIRRRALDALVEDLLRLLASEPELHGPNLCAWHDARNASHVLPAFVVEAVAKAKAA